MKEHSKKCASNENHVDFEPLESECTCDGYHTFDELYEHRITLFIALAKQVNLWDSPRFSTVWKSKRHSDGEICFGTGTQFVLGIGNKNGEQITYHVPIELWDDCYFAKTLEKAPEFDGHTADDVLLRLKKL